MIREDAIKLLDAFAGLRLCEKSTFLFEEGDIGYYFTLDEALSIHVEDLYELFFKLDASDVYVVTDEKAESKMHDQLCIYYRKANHTNV